MVISNGTGSAVRSDLNGALAALVSQNSSASAPATTYAYMLWADTTAGIMKMRNGANSAWISLWELDGTFIATDISLSAGTAGAPSLYFTGDTNTGIYSPGADQVAISTGGTARLTTTTTGITSALAVDVPLGAVGTPSITFTGDTNTGIYSPGADQVAITTGGTGRLFIDSSGRLLAGTSTARSNFFGTTLSSLTQIEGTGGSAARGSLSVLNNDVSNNPPYVLLGRSGAATLGSNAAVVSGSRLGTLTFHGADGTSFIEAATVAGEVDGTPGSNDMPGRLVFSTTADGAASPTERLRITSTGAVGIGTSGPAQLLEVQDGNIQIRNSAGLALGGVSANGLTFRNTNQVGQDRGTIAAIKSYLSTGADNDFGIQFQTQATSISGVTTKMTLTPGGALGIGTTSPSELLHLSKAGNLYLQATNTSTNVSAYFGQDSGGTYIGNVGTGSPVRFNVNNNEVARFDTSSRFLVGTSTSPSLTDGQYSKLHVIANSNSATGNGFINIGRGQAASGALGAGTSLGVLQFTDNAGAVHAAINGDTDATTGTNDYPGRLTFSTTADGAASPTERMRIDSVGAVLFKKTTKDYTTEGTVISQGASSGVDTSFVTAGGAVATFARSTNDGTIISLRQDGTEEGTISVSGTTVSYNGAHLSRWSQLPTGAEREEILRGTVLSNIDEMCEWDEEDNEQLNRMKVSDVEGDKNVSGVFQAWDDDDDTYTDDFYCAMTGDFIIRIAEGVTVERGDLLMSAGDGTAKPQDDDIIRSKTVAKVTSTNVSCTYEDGSYCVPCVLMAC